MHKLSGAGIPNRDTLVILGSDGDPFAIRTRIHKVSSESGRHEMAKRVPLSTAAWVSVRDGLGKT